MYINHKNLANNPQYMDTISKLWYTNYFWSTQQQFNQLGSPIELWAEAFFVTQSKVLKICRHSFIQRLLALNIIQIRSAISVNGKPTGYKQYNRLSLHRTDAKI